MGLMKEMNKNRRIAIRECADIYESMFKDNSESSGAKWNDFPPKLRELCIRCFECGRNH